MHLVLQALQAQKHPDAEAMLLDMSSSFQRHDSMLTAETARNAEAERPSLVGWRPSLFGWSKVYCFLVKTSFAFQAMFNEFCAQHFFALGTW